jgi:hypothetical protein
MVFVSHANPEDNEFALWLSLQLAGEGYPAWCDLTDLLGGEVFWKDIERAVRERTVKFLWVLSRASNEKTGARKELDLALRIERAEKLEDFVIPLWLDDLPISDFNVEIGNRYAIPFNKGWATGLAQLIEKLAKDGVARSATFTPNAVASWWRQYRSASTGLKKEPEPLISNWYRLKPFTLYFHELRRTSAGPLDLPPILPFPAVKGGQYLVSCAPAKDFDGHLGSELRIEASSERRYVDPAAPPMARLWTSYREERQAITQLLAQAWQAMLKASTLPTREFANKAVAFYFPNALVPKNHATLVTYGGKSTWRSVVGTKTLKDRTGTPSGLRYWHFALEARPSTHPEIGFTMRPHVLFSDDGKTIWDSVDRLHRARASQCKAWWNDDWRDRIAASMRFLAKQTSAISLPVGVTATLAVSAEPIILQSLVSLDESTLGNVEDTLAEAADQAFDDDDAAVDEVSGDSAGNEEPRDKGGAS